jgi:PleD family two-component response regulator
MIRSVILADDDSDDHLVFENALHEVSKNIKLYPVTNGLELMSLLENFVPDLLFLDLDMPYKNGLECLTEIRANKDTADLPVVVFSSTSRANNIEVAYEMGAHLFFIKPSTYKDLFGAIKTILAKDWQEPYTVKESYKANGTYIPFFM